MCVWQVLCAAAVSIYMFSPLVTAKALGGVCYSGRGALQGMGTLKKELWVIGRRLDYMERGVLQGRSA